LFSFLIFHTQATTARICEGGMTLTTLNVRGGMLGGQNSRKLATLFCDFVLQNIKEQRGCLVSIFFKYGFDW
jgi:hypothetical protein